MELNDLPDELLFKIFVDLSKSSLIDLSPVILTCKRWYKILWTQEFLKKIYSLKYQFRFIVYHHLLINQRTSHGCDSFLDINPNFAIPCLDIHESRKDLKQDIKNCPLTNITITMWCRCASHLTVTRDETILLLWHFHLGYVGFYQDGTSEKDYLLIKCTYTQNHILNSKFSLEAGKWYHIAIVIKETEKLYLYINGNLIGDWPLQNNINKDNVSIASYSSIWLGSHCRARPWDGSLFDVCIWKRCLHPYELKQIVRERVSINQVDFISDLLKITHKNERTIMFAGAHIVTTKLIHRNKRKEIIDAQVDDKNAQDLVNMAVVVPHTKAAIFVENRSDKLQRKTLAQNRKHERLVEQQKIARHMEDLMDKVIQETSLSRKDEENLRQKIKTIVTKVNKDAKKHDSSSSQLKLDSNEQAMSQGAFLLWYDKNLHE
ncbi:hypothetical protein I4U23_009280 [Adineta vaga]|nr:hypothetical protein I4U23_009280 [Adineta vaga]